MKRSSIRTAFALAGIFAAGVWPMAASADGGSAQGQSSGSSESSPSGAYGSGQGSEQPGQSGQAQSGKDQGAYGGGQQATHLSTSDQDFLKAAAQSNLSEREIVQLGEQKAASAAVRKLAQSLASDHDRVNNQLQQFASQHDVTLPSTASKQAEEKRQELSQLSGRSFDRQFLDTMISQHEEAIKDYEKLADDPNANPQVQMFAIQTLPRLRTHLVEARQAQKQIQQSGQSGQSGQGGQGSQDGMQGGGSND